jgi:predicted DNA-binding transcriptional regulator AlpA
MEQLHPLTLLRFRDLKAVGIVNNRMTLARWMKREIDPFPRPLRLSEAIIAWRASDISAWLERRAAASNGSS